MEKSLVEIRACQLISIGSRVMHQMMLMVAEMVQVIHWIGGRRGGRNSGRLIPIVAGMMVLIDEMMCVRVMRMRIEMRGHGRRRWS